MSGVHIATHTFVTQNLQQIAWTRAEKTLSIKELELMNRESTPRT